MTHVLEDGRVSLAILDDCDTFRGYLETWIGRKVDDVALVDSSRSDSRQSIWRVHPGVLIVGELLGGESAISAAVDGQLEAGAAVVVVADEALVRLPEHHHPGAFIHLRRHASFREVAAAARRTARQVRHGTVTANVSALRPTLDVDPGRSMTVSATRSPATSGAAPAAEIRRGVTRSDRAPIHARSATALSRREAEAVRNYVDGSSCQEVAEIMGVTPESVRTFLRRARAKYKALARDAGSRAALRARAVEDGLLADSGRHAGRRGQAR